MFKNQKYDKQDEMCKTMYCDVWNTGDSSTSPEGSTPSQGNV